MGNIEEKKQFKREENSREAKIARYNRQFTVALQEKECVFSTDSMTQEDLLTASIVCLNGGVYEGWITDNGVCIDLTLEDILLISAEFKRYSNVYPQWLKYEEQINKATTEEELDAIVFDYKLEVE